MHVNYAYVICIWSCWVSWYEGHVKEWDHCAAVYYNQTTFLSWQPLPHALNLLTMHHNSKLSLYSRTTSACILKYYID